MTTVQPAPISLRNNVAGLELQESIIFLLSGAFVMFRGWLLLAQADYILVMTLGWAFLGLAMLNLIFFKADRRTKLFKVALVGVSMMTVFADLWANYSEDRFRSYIAWIMWFVLVGLMMYGTTIIYGDAFVDPKQTVYLKPSVPVTKVHQGVQHMPHRYQIGQAFVRNANNKIKEVKIIKVLLDGKYLVQEGDTFYKIDHTHIIA